EAWPRMPPELLAALRIIAGDLLGVEEQELPLAAERGQLRRAVAGLRGAAGPRQRAGGALERHQRFARARRILHARIDDHELVVDQRRAAHAPLNILIALQNVDRPEQLARLQIEAD